MQETRLRAEFGTQFMAEQAVRALLEYEGFRKRTFAAIKERLGGFHEDELRQLLVRSGAVRFTGQGGTELWGLASRNDVNPKDESILKEEP